MRVLVAGAHGNTGKRLVSLLATDGYEVAGLIRDADQSDEIRELGGEPVVGDLEGDLSEHVAGCDAVIFAAGSGGNTGPEKTDDIDRDAAIALVDAAKAAGVERFVMLSSMGTREPEQGPDAMQHYFKAKAAADTHLQQSGVPFTIVRPGGLTDDDGTGMVEAAPAIDRSGSISRADVAATMVQCLKVPGTVGATFELLSGDIAIGAALESLVTS